MMKQDELLDVLHIPGAFVMLKQNYCSTKWEVVFNDGGLGTVTKQVSPQAARACLRRGELVWNRELSEWPVMIFSATQMVLEGL